MTPVERIQEIERRLKAARRVVNIETMSMRPFVDELSPFLADIRFLLDHIAGIDNERGAAWERVKELEQSIVPAVRDALQRRVESAEARLAEVEREFAAWRNASISRGEP